MIKKIILLLICIITIGTTSFSQSFYSVKRDRKFIASVGTGTSSYFGELSNDNDYMDAKLNFNVGLQYFVTDRIGARAEVTWFQLSGDDAEANDPQRVRRNLSFVSNNYEINIAGIINLFPKGQRYYQRRPFNVYGFVGIGLMYFNPKAEVPSTYSGAEAGSKVALRPLKTEGVEYARFTPVIPYGLGVKMKMGPFFNVAVEFGARKTFSDYLDDVSTTVQDPNSFDSDLARVMSDRSTELEGVDNPRATGAVRGNPDTKDAYMIANFKLEYYLSPLGIFKGGNNLNKKPGRNKYNKKRR